MLKQVIFLVLLFSAISGESCLDDSDCSYGIDHCYSVYCETSVPTLYRQCMEEDEALPSYQGGILNDDCTATKISFDLQRCNDNSNCSSASHNCCTNVTCTDESGNLIQESVCTAQIMLGSIDNGCFVSNFCLQSSDFEPINYPCNVDTPCSDYTDLVGPFCCSEFQCGDNSSYSGVSGESFCYPSFSPLETEQGCTVSCPVPQNQGCISKDGNESICSQYNTEKDEYCCEVLSLELGLITQNGFCQTSSQVDQDYKKPNPTVCSGGWLMWEVGVVLWAVLPSL